MQPKLTLNVLLSLLIDSKRTGKGKIGNGKLLVQLMMIIADGKPDQRSIERSILACYNDHVNREESYASINKMINRFLASGKYYPYEGLTFNKLKANVENGSMTPYLRKMDAFIEESIFPELLDDLIYTLLCLIAEDDTIDNLIYGNRMIPKSELAGTPAHPVTVCPAALLIGLLLHVHEHPAAGECVQLMEVPEQRPFRLVSYFNDSFLLTDKPVDLRISLRENSAHQSSVELTYDLDISENDCTITELPDSRNLYIQGAGGSGKSTLLRSLAGENSFYLPLKECPTDADDHSVLASILLKFRYCNAYDSFKKCEAVEGRDTVASVMSELEQLLQAETANGKPEYTLLLDGFNEAAQDRKRELISEISELVGYRNVRIILTGRNALPANYCSAFRTISLSGITDDALARALDGYDTKLLDERLHDLLKLPLFLQMYTSSDDSLFTRGELIDAYVKRLALDDVSRFLLLFAMPCVGWKMVGLMPEYEITRAEVQAAVDIALKLYVHNSRIYQNIVAPEGINKKLLLKSRSEEDIVELLIDTGLLEVSETDTKKVHFIHQYYRDYSAAKHILNVAAVLKDAGEYMTSDEIYDIADHAGYNTGWYDADESPDVYRLIGEISGEWVNVTFGYQQNTLVRDMTALYRRYEFTRGSENIGEVLGQICEGHIGGYDFHGLTIPIMPACIYSDCSFRNASIGYIPLLEPDDELLAETEELPPLEKSVIEEVIASHEPFKNCDFTGCHFVIEEYRDILGRMGNNIG